MSQWREPPAETEDYPGLWVHDGRVAGSITIGQSRLPLWAILPTAILETWDDVEQGWGPLEHYGYTADDLVRFLHDLLNVRGEFARLLLVLADAERRTDEAEQAVLDRHADESGEILVKVWPPGPDTVELPAPWWETGQRDVVIAALRLCLDLLNPIREPAEEPIPIREIPASVRAMADDDQAPTAPLEDFLTAMRADDNWWWRVACGHHLNLFEAAVDEIDGLRAARPSNA